jgi:hypothetical protein
MKNLEQQKYINYSYILDTWSADRPKKKREIIWLVESDSDYNCASWEEQDAFLWLFGIQYL